jgi:diguanylate cyclase (GGDEF)-like protein/PAS domain S-box-containing protein
MIRVPPTKGLEQNLLRGDDGQNIASTDILFERVSESTMPLLGYVPAELSGTNAFRLFHPDDAGRVLASLSDALQQAEMTETIDARMLRSVDEWTHVEMRVRDLQDQPSIGGLLLVARDITERKQFEEQLERRALYDALTGLPNRVLFMDYLSHSLARAERRLESVVVMFLDLDNFKRVNDTWGHGAGDQLLAKVAERLRNALRAVDSAARLSGDEFTVLLEDVRTESDAATVAERVLRALGNPFELSGTIVPVTTSIGIAISRPGESSAGALLHEADIALYRAKAAGKARWVLHNQQQATDSASDAAEHTYPADVAVSAPPATRPATTVAATPATSDEALQTLLQRVIDLERQAGWLEAEVERERGRHQP